VRYIFQKYLKTDEVADSKSISPPWKIMKRQRRLLCKTSRNNPFFTARKVWTAAGNMLEVSLNTMKRYLKQNNSTVVLQQKTATK